MQQQALEAINFWIHGLSRYFRPSGMVWSANWITGEPSLRLLKYMTQACPIMACQPKGTVSTKNWDNVFRALVEVRFNLADGYGATPLAAVSKW